jgi:hypothetical protein
MERPSSGTTSTILVPHHRSPNLYRHNDKLEIEISTVHGVKGQTHQATLLVETYYDKKFHIQSILPYLIGNPPKKEKSKNVIQKFLPLGYVATTRPTELICLAMMKDHVDETIIQSLKSAGWTTKEI